NRTLLLKIPNPSTNSDLFATAMAAVTTDRVLIGARNTDPAGAAYIFDLRPSLTVSKTETNTVSVSWPSAWTGWTLQRNTNLISTNWSAAPEPVSEDETVKSILVSTSASNGFYRLIRP
ncbi:MAG TPA: hypothetical protein VK530_04450, partial [Candidatus Acidoferrum sp.]|nr:hypothetical protein [Candidatus Acidoferrum sp.]